MRSLVRHTVLILATGCFLAMTLGLVLFLHLHLAHDHDEDPQHHDSEHCCLLPATSRGHEGFHRPNRAGARRDRSGRAASRGLPRHSSASDHGDDPWRPRSPCLTPPAPHCKSHSPVLNGAPAAPAQRYPEAT